MFGELVDDPARARVADVELPLHQRDGGSAFRRHGPRRPREQRIQLALAGLTCLPFRAGSLFEDLLHESGCSLRLPERHDLFDFLVADESTLDARRLACVDGLVQHVAAAEELLRTAAVENDAAVDLG